MAANGTYHQIPTRGRKSHGFSTILWRSGDSSSGHTRREEVCRNPGRTKPNVDSANRVINQICKRCRIREGCVDVAGLSPVVVDHNLVKSRDDKIYGSPCLYIDLI